MTFTLPSRLRGTRSIGVEPDHHPAEVEYTPCDNPPTSGSAKRSENGRRNPAFGA